MSSTTDAAQVWGTQRRPQHPSLPPRPGRTTPLQQPGNWREIMDYHNFTTTFTVDQTPEQAFAAINDVRGWWSGEITGSTDKLNDEFTYRYEDVHYSKQRITESIPGERIVWLVLDSYLNFVEDTTEWTGTEITFEISRKGNQTEICFNHVGLAEHECFDVCSNAWGTYVNGSLRSLITTGKGRPNLKEKAEAGKASV